MNVSMYMLLHLCLIYLHFVLCCQLRIKLPEPKLRVPFRPKRLQFSLSLVYLSLTFKLLGVFVNLTLG